MMFRRFYSVKIHQKFTSPDQIRQFLRSPTWSPTDLLSNQSQRCSTIDESTVTRLLQMSGLQADVEEYPQIISTLKEQVRFIDHLHAVEVKSEEPLVGKRLTLDDIKQQIKNQKQDTSKGETSGSWDPISLASHSKHGHYIVREGLLKE